MIRAIVLSLLLLSVWSVGFTLFTLPEGGKGGGPGLRVSRASARSSGMGGAGSALCDTLNASVANPASFALLDFTLLTVTWAPDVSYLQDGQTGETFTGITSDFQSTGIAIPLGPYGVVFGGYIRDRILDYDARFMDAAGQGLHRTGHGGTWNAQLGYAYAWDKRFLAGASVGAMHGATTEGTFVETVPSGASPFARSAIQKNTYGAYIADAGVIARLKTLSAGISVTLPISATDITVEEQGIQHHANVGDSAVDTRKSSYSSRTVPLSGTVGLAWSPSRRSHFALDVNYVDWNETSRSAETRVGLGFEQSFADGRNESYWRNIPLRVGYYYHDLGITGDIFEQALTFGFSLPTAGNFGIINIGLEGGKRYQGSLAETPLTETFSRLSVQLVHKGRWGRLRKAATSDF